MRIWKLWTCSLRIELNGVCWISIWSYPHFNKKLTWVDEKYFQYFDYFRFIPFLQRISLGWMMVFCYVTFFRHFGRNIMNSTHILAVTLICSQSWTRTLQELEFKEENLFTCATFKNKSFEISFGGHNVLFNNLIQINRNRK